MIDVFLCRGSYRHVSKNLFDFRTGIQVGVQSWWEYRQRSTGDINLHELWEPSDGPADWQRTRRMLAEEKATTPYYILADDDALPHQNFSAQLIEDIMNVHPDFAILSLRPINSNINRWAPDDYTPFLDNIVEEHVDVGVIRVMRRKAMTWWPQQEGLGYDRTQCQWLRDHGWRVGFINHPDLSCWHAGERASAVWRNTGANSSVSILYGGTLHPDGEIETL